MVSDASSGPPHFQEDEEGYCNDDNGCFYPPSMAPTLLKNNGKRQKVRTFRGRVEQEDPSFLDDTASSPLFNFSKVSQYYSEPPLMNQRLRCGDFLIHFLFFFFYQFHRTKTRLQWRACWIFLKASPQPTWRYWECFFLGADYGISRIFSSVSWYKACSFRGDLLHFRSILVSYTPQCLGTSSSQTSSVYSLFFSIFFSSFSISAQCLSWLLILSSFFFLQQVVWREEDGDEMRWWYSRLPHQNQLLL